MKTFRQAIVFFFLSFLILGGARASEDLVAGEIFGKSVSKEDFDFAYKTTGIFSITGQAASDDTVRRTETWKHLIFLREAEKRNLEIPQESVQNEMARLFTDKNIKVGSFEYHEFIKTNFGEDAKTFEKRLRDLLRVSTLIRTSGINAQNILEEAHLKETAQAAPKLQEKGAEKTMIIETNQGTIEVKLFPDVAPKAVENFTTLAEKKYYDGTVFHRVIDGFMIQGGDPTATGRGGESTWGKPFEDEVKKDVGFDRAGLLAMANAGPRTNGSQFFITLGPTPHLNMRHTIFGEVVSGMDIVKKIGSTSVDRNDKPNSDQKILRMTVKK